MSIRRPYVELRLIRLLAEPTSDRQVQEATGALELSVHEVHEHSSTEATPQLSAGGRLCKKSILSYGRDSTRGSPSLEASFEQLKRLLFEAT